MNIFKDNLNKYENTSYHTEFSRQRHSSTSFYSVCPLEFALIYLFVCLFVSLYIYSLNLNVR